MESLASSGSSSRSSLAHMKKSKSGPLQSPRSYDSFNEASHKNKQPLRKSEMKLKSSLMARSTGGKENTCNPANGTRNESRIIAISMSHESSQIKQIIDWKKSASAKKAASSSNTMSSNASTIKYRASYKNQEPMRLDEDDYNEPESSDAERKTISLKLLIKFILDIYASNIREDIRGILYIFLELLESPSEESKVYSFELIFNVALHLSLFDKNEVASTAANNIFLNLRRKLIKMMIHLVDHEEQSMAVWKTAFKAFFVFFDATDSLNSIRDPRIILSILKYVEDLPWESVQNLLVYYLSFLQVKMVEKIGLSAFFVLLQDQVQDDCQKLVFNVIYDYVIHHLQTRKRVDKAAFSALEQILEKTKFWMTCRKLLFHMQKDFVESYTLQLFQDQENHSLLRHLDKTLLVSFFCDFEMLVKAHVTTVHERNIGEFMQDGLVSLSFEKRCEAFACLKAKLISPKNGNIVGNIMDRFLVKCNIFTKIAIADILYSLILKNGQQDLIDLYLRKFTQIKDINPRLSLRLFYMTLDILDLSMRNVSDKGDMLSISITSQKSLDLFNPDILRYLFSTIPGRNFKAEKLVALSLLIHRSSRYQVDASFYYDLVKNSRDPVICYMVARYLIQQVRKENPSLLQRLDPTCKNYFLLVQQLLSLQP